MFLPRVVLFRVVIQNNETEGVYSVVKQEWLPDEEDE